MDGLVERLAVGLSGATSRRGFLGRLCRAAVGIGIGITTLAIGGPAFAVTCDPRSGGTHNGSCHGSLSGGCDGTACSGCGSGGQCPAGCDTGNYRFSATL